MTVTTNERNISTVTPEDGKWLTNGTVYSQKVILGKNASPDDWWEVDSKPEQEPINEISDSEALAIIMGGDGE